MSNILNTIAEYAAVRVERSKRDVSFEDMRDIALEKPIGSFLFSEKLKKQGMSFISEIKKASPSKGLIDPIFDYKKIANDYLYAGTDCISCLTEPKWFLGSDEIFKDVRSICNLPMLRKDFTIDEYQIYEAKCLGADCILLICALLDANTLEKYLTICKRLGMDALVETHSAEEIHSAVLAGADIIGVNNRNLKNFDVNLDTAKRLRELVPSDKIFVAESGIQSPEDVKEFSQIGADAVLIGEMLMRAPDKAALLSRLKEVSKR